MMDGPEKQTFGGFLRFFRGQTVNRKTGRPLSQGQLGTLLTDKLGLIITRNKVNNWEMDKNSPHPQRERDHLIVIVEILLKYKGIKTVDEANQLLQAGNYQPLTKQEIDRINQAWNPPVVPQKTDENTKAKTSTVSPGGSGPLDVRIIDPVSVIHPKAMYGPGSAPPMPSFFIGREEDLGKLKENLGVTTEHGMTLQILTAIKGWPGVGKTTIASALAYDPDIQKAFPDGVMWVSLGQEPNLLSEIAAWGRALGTDELLRAQTLEEAVAQLAALLRNERMLLIIDDVWAPEHAVPFNVGGPNCATLVTTRRDDVAAALAPSADNIYRLKVLKDQDALELLRRLAPTVVGKYFDECLVLVQELEGLPLALQVAGRLLNTEEGYGFDVKQLMDELRAGARLLESAAPADRIDLVTETTPTIAALLQKSLERLDDQTRDCYAYLGVFAAKPATFDMDAMKFVWQMEDPKPVIKTLVDRGLLEFVPELGRYQMHALLVMLAKTLLTEEEE